MKHESYFAARHFFGVFGWLAVFFSGGKPGLAPAGELLFFSKAKKKASHVRALRVPCATRKMEHPRSGFAASPSRGRHQRPGKAGSAVPLVGAALRLPSTRGSFAALTSRGLGCLIPHASLLSRARHAVPLHQTPSFLNPQPSRGQPQGLPLRPSLLRPHSSLLRPHSYDLTPHLAGFSNATSCLTTRGRTGISHIRTSCKA